MKTVQQDVNALCVVGREIDTFDAPEFPPNLVSLRLYNCAIRDFESMRLLKHLRELHLCGCDLGDIVPVGCLTELSHLSVAHNQIANIAPLSHCTALAWLDLRHNNIADVSPLTALDKLAYLDIRGNPRGTVPEGDDDVGAIMRRNPTAHVRLGVDPNTIHRDMLEQVLLAKGRVADFALGAKWHFHDAFPNLPVVSAEVADALRLLRDAHDGEYMADVSIVLLRYAIDILASIHTGTLLSTDNPHPFLQEFLRIVPRDELFGDEVTTGAIAYWICNYRNKIPPSLVLDTYVQRYRQVESVLDEEWKALRARRGGN